MNIIVCVKHVPDTEAVIKPHPDGSGIALEGSNYVLNPYDEYAVEEAIRIKEANADATITVITVGPDDATKSLRTAIAMGADDAIHLNDPAFLETDSQGIATILAAAIRPLPYDLILCGKQAVDNDCAQVGAALAELLGIPGISVITELSVETGKATAHRELEGATEIIECTLPALFTAQKGLNEPRYPALPMIMKAKRKEIKTLDASALGLSPGDFAPRSRRLKVSSPPPRQAGRVLEGKVSEVVTEVVRLIREEAKIL
ncbi:MAG: electron transfer flavoprotein subunit beta/FixA family protein [Candidatus Eisenbacteria sp.]|nr:electron transfer flavoprotein subunit beta/FixA family protein [Candidatus Eisenbacteria bacterium]